MPFLELKSLSMHYEEAGSGTPLLMLHELGGSTQSWRHVMDELATDFRVIALDYRGAGLSEKPRTQYSLELLVNDILELMDLKQISSTHIVGAALGAVLGIEIAKKAPERVRSMVLCSIAPAIAPEARAYVLDRAQVIRSSGMRAAVERSAINSFPEEIMLPFEQARKDYSALYLSHDPDAYASLSEAMMQWEPGETLASIKQACLCLAGSHDFIWNETTVRSAASKLVNAQFAVVPRAGHFPAQSAPAAFLDLCRPFLKRNDRP